jgi:signal transduction histidine kinase
MERKTKKQKETNDMEVFLPSVEEYNHSQEEYIRSLEMVVQLLQREVDHLRSQLKPTPSSKKTRFSQKEISIFNEASTIFNACVYQNQVLLKLHDYIAKQFSIIESSIAMISSNNKLQPITDSTTSSTLSSLIQSFEEEGLVDWAFENSEPSIIPNLNEAIDDLKTYFIFVPLYIRGTRIGMFFAKTTLDKEQISQSDLKTLSIITDYAAIALDNIKSSEEITKINRRLNVLNTQMLHSSKLASVGEIAGSIAKEIDNPLQIVNAHLQLLESGVGDKKRRIQIIKEQIGKISEITSRLSNFSETLPLDLNPTPVKISNLIDEVLLFSGSQLQRDAIIVEKEYDDESIEILGLKPQLEQVFLNILLFARDSMPEGGRINIGIYKFRDSRITINISDDGNGLSDIELNHIFEPVIPTEIIRKGFGTTGLFLTKNIIQQHKGNISVFSEISKGTTFKLQFPIFKLKK